MGFDVTSETDNVLSGAEKKSEGVVLSDSQIRSLRDQIIQAGGSLEDDEKMADLVTPEVMSIARKLVPKDTPPTAVQSLTVNLVRQIIGLLRTSGSAAAF